MVSSGSRMGLRDSLNPLRRIHWISPIHTETRASSESRHFAMNSPGVMAPGLRGMETGMAFGMFSASFGPNKTSQTFVREAPCE